MTPVNQNKGGSAQDENTLPSCQKKTGSYTIGSGWGVCQNWVVLSYVGGCDFEGFDSTRLTVINKIIYFKTHTTSYGRVFCLQSCLRHLFLTVHKTYYLCFIVLLILPYYVFLWVL